MINKKGPFCLIIAVVISSMLFTGCPKSGEEKKSSVSEHPQSELHEQSETSIMGDGDDEPETEDQPKSTTKSIVEHDDDLDAHVSKIEGLLN